MELMLTLSATEGIFECIESGVIDDTKFEDRIDCFSSMLTFLSLLIAHSNKIREYVQSQEFFLASLAHFASSRRASSSAVQSYPSFVSRLSVADVACAQVLIGAKDLKRTKITLDTFVRSKDIGLQTSCLI